LRRKGGVACETCEMNDERVARTISDGDVVAKRADVVAESANFRTE